MKRHLYKLIKTALVFPFVVSLASAVALQNNLYLTDINTEDLQGRLNRIKTENSLIITDPKILKEIEKEHSFGQKMGELAYNQKVTKNGNDKFGVKDSPSYIWRAFMASDLETKENNRRMDANRAGNYKDVPVMPYSWRWNSTTAQGIVRSAFKSTAIGVNRRTNITPYKHLINLWPELRAIEYGRNYKKGSKQYRYDPKHVGKGPFRLLAVVNRMDMSGNLPRGSGPFGFVDPRAFGEVHFIYGVVDSNYERQTKKAYPHTLQITYRLPPLSSSFNAENQNRRNGNRNQPSTHESFIMNSGHAKWRTYNERWAKLWRQLSRLNINNQSGQFANHLHAILERSATPDNFLNMNSNVAVGGFFHTRRKKLYGYENELKAYYANQGSKSLFPTGMERDSYRCGINTKYLRNLVNSYMKTYPADGDFFQQPVKDLMVFNPNYNHRVSNFSGLNTYMIANNTHSSGPTHPALDGNQNGLIGKNYLPGCVNSDNGKTPYRLASSSGQIELMPRISRTRWNFAWNFPNQRGLPNVSEEARHGFAMRSCSGCHGKETRTNGFHIENRLANATAKRSLFLNESSIGTLKIVGNIRYRYETIKDRKDWLYRSIEKENSIKPGYGLLRKSDRRY